MKEQHCKAAKSRAKSSDKQRRKAVADREAAVLGKDIAIDTPSSLPPPTGLPAAAQ